MDAASLIELAERCERATQGSKELDEAICQAVGFGWRVENFNWPTTVARDFTSSIDAALTLVPEEWQAVYLASEWTGISRTAAVESGYIEFRATLRRGVHSYVIAEGKSKADLSLALCAAALRAHAEERHLSTPA